MRTRAGSRDHSGNGRPSLGDGSDADAGGGEVCKRWRANTCARHVTPCGTHHPYFTPSTSHAFIIFSSTQTTTTTAGSGGGGGGGDSDDDDDYDENRLLYV